MIVSHFSEVKFKIKYLAIQLSTQIFTTLYLNELDPSSSAAD